VPQFDLIVWSFWIIFSLLDLIFKGNIEGLPFTYFHFTPSPFFT